MANNENTPNEPQIEEENKNLDEKSINEGTSNNSSQTEETGASADSQLEEEEEVEVDIEKYKEMASLVESLTEDNKILKDKLLRTHADYQNYRRRIQDDLIKRSELGKYQLLTDLILLLDQLFLINKNWTTDGPKNIEVVSSFFKSFKAELEKIGFKQIETIGKKVDLRYHEIVKSPEKANEEELIIVSDVQAGYMFNDRVIRPAKVELGISEISEKKSDDSSDLKE